MSQTSYLIDSTGFPLVLIPIVEFKKKHDLGFGIFPRGPATPILIIVAAFLPSGLFAIIIHCGFRVVINLSGWHRTVGDKFILTCDQKGKVSVWNMSAALDPSLRGDPTKMLVNKLSAPVSPYLTYRKVSVLSMEADELQIVLLLKYDNKPPVLYVMDFLADNDKENVRTQPSRKRRSQ